MPRAHLLMRAQQVDEHTASGIGATKTLAKLANPIAKPDLLARGAMLQAEIDARRGTPAVVAALAAVEAQTECNFEFLEQAGRSIPPAWGGAIGPSRQSIGMNERRDFSALDAKRALARRLRRCRPHNIIDQTNREPGEVAIYTLSDSRAVQDVR